MAETIFRTIRRIKTENRIYNVMMTKRERTHSVIL